MARISVEQVEACGVVGAGGAGFPTHVKLKASADTIILNAAECEPLLHKDKEMLRAFPDEILDGLRQAGEMVGATEAVIGVKGKYHDVIELLAAKLPAGMRIQELTDSYPSGDEFILVYDVTKRIIPPGKIPLVVGCVVINVETAYNIARGVPVTEKFLTVAGAVNSPATVKVPVGVTFAETIALAGGASIRDPVALIGGVMMGKLCTDLSEPVTKTTGGLIVLPRDHRLIERYSLDWQAISRIGASACDQCNFCTEFCPRYLLGHPIEPHKAMRSLEFTMMGESNTIGTQFCCECNLCSLMACPEDLDPKNVCTQNKRRLAAEGRKWEVEANPVRVELHLDNRRVPIGRLIRKLGLYMYENKGPLVEATRPAKRVVLPLKQHVGAPAEPTVSAGGTVKAGDVIAKPAGGKLGAVIHASIAGRVTAVDDAITIEC
ncbi:MAG: 4Fe-4S dicluster domain-containing protein [Planctomycetes bacterium]|nr:4Fe-4S dicluster domain-containing protein [Planctomycetota bacterium]